MQRTITLLLLFILLFSITSFAQKKHVFNLSLLKQERPFLNERIIENTDVLSPLFFKVLRTPGMSLSYKYHFKNGIYLGVDFGWNLEYWYVLDAYHIPGDNAQRPDTLFDFYTAYDVPEEHFIYKLNFSISYDWYLDNQHVINFALAPGVKYIDGKTQHYQSAAFDMRNKFNVTRFKDYYFEDKGGVTKGGLFFTTNLSLSYKFLMGMKRNYGIGLTANYQQGFVNIFERNVKVYQIDNPSIFTDYQLSAKGSSYSLGLDFIFQFGN